MEKTDEQKFIDWLKPSQKTYKKFDLKEFPKLGDWDKVLDFKTKSHKFTLGILTCLLGWHKFGGDEFGQQCVICKKIRV